MNAFEIKLFCMQLETPECIKFWPTFWTRNTKLTFALNERFVNKISDIRIWLELKLIIPNNKITYTEWGSQVSTCHKLIPAVVTADVN